MSTTRHLTHGHGGIALPVDEEHAVRVAQARKFSRRKDSWERDEARKKRKKAQITLPKFSWDK